MCARSVEKTRLVTRTRGFLLRVYRSDYEWCVYERHMMSEDTTTDMMKTTTDVDVMKKIYESDMMKKIYESDMMKTLI